MAVNNKKKKGLGKGLDNLFEDNRISIEKIEADGEGKGLIKVNINLIDPNKDQPRKNFEDDKLKELAESIKEHGIIEPLIVKKEDKRFKLIAGERRFRAARLAGIKEVPVVIGDYSDREIVEIALIENLQREDLNPIEEAVAYQKLIDEFSLRQEEVAETVSKSRTTITNSLRLLKLDERIQDMVIEGKLSGGHARCLLSIEDKEHQFALATKIVDEELTVRQAEKLVRDMSNPSSAKGKKSAKTKNGISAEYKEFEKKLSGFTGVKVEIQQKDENKGKIIIPYSSVEEFEKIYSIFSKTK